MIKDSFLPAKTAEAFVALIEEDLASLAEEYPQVSIGEISPDGSEVELIIPQELVGKETAIEAFIRREFWSITCNQNLTFVVR